MKQKLEAASAVVQRNLAISAAAEQRAIAGEAVHNQPPKQEVVHKQFNSPLALYSEENVKEVMALQSGLIPPNPKAQPGLDLKNSETLKALLEEDVADKGPIKEYQPAPVKVLPVNPPFKVTPSVEPLGHWSPPPISFIIGSRPLPSVHPILPSFLPFFLSFLLSFFLSFFLSFAFFCQFLLLYCFLTLSLSLSLCLCL